MPINSSGTPLLSTGARGDVRPGAARIRSVRTAGSADISGLTSAIAESHVNLQQQIDQLATALRQNQSVSSFSVTGLNGGLISWIGNALVGSVQFIGAWFKDVYLGGGDASAAQIYSDPDGNISLEVRSLSRCQVYASQFDGADIGAKINAAYTALPSGGGEIIVDLSGSFSTPIVFGDTDKVAILQGFGNGVSLAYAPTSASTAITFDNGLAFDFVSGMDGITLTGSGTGHSTVGVTVGGSNGAVGFTMSNCRIQTFGTNFLLASNTWLLRFVQCMFRDSHRLMVLPSGLSQSGENIIFDHCCFADAVTPHTNAVWVQGGGQEAVFSGCSFDQAQLRIGNGGTSAAQVVVTGCHFENPNFSVAGSVDYDYVVVDNNNGNYLRLTDCYMLQDRDTAGTYTRFLDLQGGVVSIMNLGMFTPALAPLGNLCRLANAVNVNLFGFNDLSGNILGSLYSGSTTGFINSFPGTSTATATGYNTIVGPGSLTGGAAINFLTDFALGLTATNVHFTVHGDQTIVDAVTNDPKIIFNNGSGSTAVVESGATDAFSVKDEFGVRRFEIVQAGGSKIKGTLNVNVNGGDPGDIVAAGNVTGGGTDMASLLASVNSLVTAVASLNTRISAAHTHGSGSYANGFGPVTGTSSGTAL